MKALLILTFLFLTACSGKQIESLTITPVEFKKWQHEQNELYFDTSNISDYGLGEVRITDIYNYDCRFDSEFIGNGVNGSVVLKSKTQGGEVCDQYLGQYYYTIEENVLELCDSTECNKFY